MMQNSAVMASRRSASAAFDIQVINKSLIKISFRLAFIRDTNGLLLIVSQDRCVRQVAFSNEEVGDDVQSFLAVQDPAAVASRVISTEPVHELDDEQFFPLVEQNLKALSERCVISSEALDDHMAMLVLYREYMNSEGMISYLHAENLSDVVEDSRVLMVKPEEAHFWKTIWKSIVNKAVAMNGQPNKERA
jgi:hypothetical protein